MRMATIVDKVNSVVTANGKEKVRRDIIIALSGIHLAKDTEGMYSLFWAYVRMLERITSNDHPVENAALDMELLAHAADLYPLKGDDAFSAAMSTWLDYRSSYRVENGVGVGPVRQFYLSVLEEKLKGFESRA